MASIFLREFFLLLVESLGHLGKSFFYDLCEILILRIRLSIAFLEPIFKRFVFCIFLAIPSIVGHVCAPAFLAKIPVHVGLAHFKPHSSLKETLCFLSSDLPYSPYLWLGLLEILLFSWHCSIFSRILSVLHRSWGIVPWVRSYWSCHLGRHI